jgi:hypothetical protein
MSKVRISISHLFNINRNLAIGRAVYLVDFKALFSSIADFDIKKCIAFKGFMLYNFLKSYYLQLIYKELRDDS